jgi:hypothetical protein
MIRAVVFKRGRCRSHTLGHNALAFFQIEHVQALSKPVVECREVHALGTLVLIPPVPREACVNLPGVGLLRAADFERAFEIGLRLCRNALQTSISTTRSVDPILLVLR